MCWVNLVAAITKEPSLSDVDRSTSMQFQSESDSASDKKTAMRLSPYFTVGREHSSCNLGNPLKLEAACGSVAEMHATMKGPRRICSKSGPEKGVKESEG